MTNEDTRATDAMPAQVHAEGAGVLDELSVVDIAKDLLTRRFGGMPELDEVELLSGAGNAVVVRARLAPSAFLPYRSVVVKHMPHSDSDIDDAAFLREVVAYQFTTALPQDVRPGPVLLAYDMEQRIVVLTDIGEADTLVERLQVASDDERITVLRLLGEQLGHMHAGTALRERDYNALLSRMLGKYPEFREKQAARDAVLHDSILVGEAIMRAAGLEPPAEFIEFAHHAAEIQQHGLARAFTPFDLSPDNIVISDQIYFLDYEWAGFRNVGFDVASVIAGFPQFLFSRPISNVEAEVFQSAWRREITEIWPRYTDTDKLHNLIVSSLVGWSLSSLAILYADRLDGDQGVGAALGSVDRGLNEPACRALLSSGGHGRFSEDELLVRQDLCETFEALARYAAACEQPRYRAVADFANSVAARLEFTR